MGYSGQTYSIQCNVGGLNNNKNIDLIPPTAMVEPSRNINLNQGGRKKRGGTQLVNSGNQLGGGTRVRGVYQYVPKTGATSIITSTAEVAVYDDYTTAITNTTDWTSDGHVMFDTAEDELYMANGLNKPQIWSGSGNTTNITSPTADWTGTNQPKHILRHARAEAARMWAYGVTSQPQRLYYSTLLDGSNSKGQEFTGGTSGQIDIETGGGDGIVACVDFNQTLMVFGVRQSYIIEDTDSDHTNWGYYKAPFEGGVGGLRLLIVTPYDLIVMAEDGEIYSVATATQYGDYKAASLTAPSFMHEWIKEFVDLTAIDNFHGIYDPVLRAIMYFVQRKDASNNNTALVYFIDRGPEHGWMVHDNRENDSGYKASSSTLARTAAGTFKIYTGGWADGYVWELNNTNQDDNGAAYSAGFKTARLPFDNPRSTKRYDRLWVVAQEEGSYNLDIDWWVDGVAQTQINVDLSSDGNFTLDSATDGVLDTDILGGDAFIDADTILGEYGKRIEFSINNNRANEDFFVSQLLIDHKQLTLRASKDD